MNRDGVEELFERGVGLIGEGRLEEALECFEEVLRIDPGHVNALLRLASVLFLLGRGDEALEALDRVVEIDEGNEEARLMRVFMLGELERWEELEEFVLGAC